MIEDIIVTSSDIGSIRTYLATRFLREIQLSDRTEEDFVGIAKAYLDQNPDKHSVKQALEEYGSAEEFSRKILEGMVKAKSIIRLEDGAYRKNIELRLQSVINP